MTNKRFTTVCEVVSWRLCMGCGACAVACRENNIRLVNVPEQGLRPVVNPARCQKCGECVKVCPGIEVSHQPFNGQTITELQQAWGPVLELWEGYATDPETRFKGSSGGVVTALALFCLEKEQAAVVLHIGAKSEAPLQNAPVFSRSREELLACTGSRYSPAAPCERLRCIGEAKAPCVFIGKPCDVVGLRKSQAMNEELNKKVSLAISIFCAGTPSTNGTRALLDVLDVKPNQVAAIRYRGCGWPGMTTVTIKGSGGQTRKMTYEESWGNILSHYGQFRCRLCPDSTGEFADISCGDPWYREIELNDPGWSLVVVRTERGREILQKAATADYIELKRVNPSALWLSEKALLSRRYHLWGRLLAMRMMQVPIPRYKGFSLFKNWLRLPAMEKLRSVGGTLKRIILRRWTKPLKPIKQGNIGREVNSAEGTLVNLDRFESQCKV